MAEQADVLLEVRNLKQYFPIRKGIIRRKVGEVKAVDDVSFGIHDGETLGLVGESGCGKSTTGRTILRLNDVTSGQILFRGRDITRLRASEMRHLRPEMQMIFQDPYSSLNPRMTVRNFISEPLLAQTKTGREERYARVAELLDLVGMDRSCGDRYPHEFSGGQRQRVGIAAALALNPKLVICDEPVAALDVSIQAQVINLLKDLQSRLHLTYLFISHDLSMVQHITQRVAVMYLGKLMELSDQETIYERPAHPYTRALLSAVPIPDPRRESKRKRIVLSGDVPNPAAPPSGCPFHTRCPIAEPACSSELPAWREIEPRHWVACRLA